ncbi:MAG: UMP kinase [Mycoplasmataceae bacterium]|jgi:uridylate kinase|nr:UMP kinase [Mycoplasmataceae bacterium]
MQSKQRIILKFSGAVLKDNKHNTILAVDKLNDLAKQIKRLINKYQIIIVVGGGNIWRGSSAAKNLYREEKAHFMGMIATCINAIAIQEALLKHYVDVHTFSLLSIPTVIDNYNAKTALKVLAQNHVVILAGGTGKPFFSTDTGAAQVAVELKAKQIVMGKDGVDGVYSADPKINKNAKRFAKLTINEAIKLKLKVMDQSALAICQKHHIDLLVFNAERSCAIIKALEDKIPTTLVEAK